MPGDNFDLNLVRFGFPNAAGDGIELRLHFGAFDNEGLIFGGGRLAPGFEQEGPGVNPLGFTWDLDFAQCPDDNIDPNGEAHCERLRVALSLAQGDIFAIDGEYGESDAYRLAVPYAHIVENEELSEEASEAYVMRKSS